MNEYDNRVFWYALLIAIIRTDLTADDALREMEVAKVGTYIRKRKNKVFFVFYCRPAKKLFFYYI